MRVVAQHQEHFRSPVMRVIEADPQTDERWEQFVLAHPHGTVCHHPGWLKALADEYGRKPLCLACEDEHGRFRGILPLFHTQGLPLFTKSPLVCRRLSSLPRTSGGGPLTLDQDATKILVREAIERAERLPGTVLQLKLPSPALSGLIDGVEAAPGNITYVLHLPRRVEDLRFGDVHNHARIRRTVKRAARVGIHVRHGETESDLADWYSLYLESMRWRVTPPRRYRFFRSLWHLLRPPGLLRLLLAEQHCNGRRNLLAGALFFMFRDVVTYGFTGSRRQYLCQRPNDLIQWQAINDACRAGFRVYDLGEVPDHNQGLADFKSKFGALPIRLYRYYYPRPETLEKRPADFGGAQRFLTAVWRHLPLQVTAFLGCRVNAYL